MNDALSRSDELSELFGRLAGGDRTALPRAFRVLQPLIQRFCEKLLGRGPDADDAAQQSLERVFERIGTYDVSKHALPWVFSIASWEVKTLRRRAWRSDQRAASVGVEELVGTNQDPESAAMGSQILEALDELIESLPEVDRATMHEALQRELAPDLVPSDATFRKRKERVLHKIRALLRNLGHVQ